MVPAQDETDRVLERDLLSVEWLSYDGEESRDFVIQQRQIAFDDLPHQLNIHPKIIVNQFIPHSGNRFPGYVRMCGFE